MLSARDGFYAYRMLTAGVPGSPVHLGVSRASPVVIDALLGTVATLAIALIIAADQGGDRPPDVVAYLFALGFGALMLLRRRVPRTVLGLTVLGMFAYYALDYPPIGVAVPVVAALFSAADAGLTLWSVGAGAVVFAVSLVFRLREGESPAFLLGYEAVSNIALIAAAIALGYSLRIRRIRAAQQAEITRLTTLQLAREAEARVQSERERISRDLHDTVGHTMSVISLQAGVAAEAIDPTNAVAAEAIDHIRSASRQTLQDLRSIVRILRSAGIHDAESGVLSLSAVPGLVDTVRSVGVAVTALIDVDPGELSPPVDAAAYRVVQEALTNVVKHAAARSAHVSAKVRDGTLHVTIGDDGHGVPSPGPVPGHGLEGMTERVRLLGGTLRTLSEPDGGFTVEALIPAKLAP